MAKARSLDPAFWDDPDIVRLTRDERLLLVGMITLLADDEGRLIADAGYLRKRVFGYDDGLAKQEVEVWRDSIVQKCHNVKCYTVNGQVYIWLATFCTYQKIRYTIPSRLPPYTEESSEVPSNKEDYGKLPESSVDSPRVKVGLRLSRVGLSDAAAPQTPAPKGKPPKRTLASHPLPVDFAVTEAMRQWAKNKGITQFIDIDKHTARFIGYWTEGEGQGRPKKNWRLTWENWMEDEATKAEARGVHIGGINGGTHRQNSVEIGEAKRPTRVPGLREALEERRSQAKST